MCRLTPRLDRGSATAKPVSGFSLRAFHDRLWLEGNVPIALQRWELLGDRADLDRIDHLAAVRE